MSSSNRQNSVLITGARGRLGKALSAAFDAQGWDVWAANRTPEAGPQCLELDLASDASIAAAAEALFAASSPKELALVANASNREALSPDWESCGREQFHGVFDVDVVGHFMLARALREAAMAAGTRLTVLFVGSMYGQVGVKPHIYPAGMAPSPLQYSVAKAALNGLTRDLAGRWGPDGIRVNCLAPGGIAAGQAEEFVAAYAGQTPSGRLSEADEIAATAVMLCDPASQAVNGQIISADGGWTAW